MLRRLMFTRIPHTLLLATAFFVSMSAAYAQMGSAAKVEWLTGRVDVLRDDGRWALAIGAPVQARQRIITGPDGFARFRMTDNSTFDVFPNSETVFRENAFNWRDVLDVVLGRVKVHIEKLNGQPNDTKVHTPTAIISVRGTTFDVDVVDLDATTVVSVEEGVVEVAHRLLPGKPAILHDGESIQVFANRKIDSPQVDRSGKFQMIYRLGEKAFSDWLVHRPGSGGGPMGSAGGTAQADKDKSNPPPPSAPPPPAPPK